MSKWKDGQHGFITVRWILDDSSHSIEHNCTDFRVNQEKHWIITFGEKVIREKLEQISCSLGSSTYTQVDLGPWARLSHTNSSCSQVAPAVVSWCTSDTCVALLCRKALSTCRGEGLLLKRNDKYGAPGITIAKLVYITTISLWLMVLTTMVFLGLFSSNLAIHGGPTLYK